MAKVGAQRAADVTGVSKSTIQRAMKNGKLSFSKDANGYRVIDISELERVYGLKSGVSDATQPARPDAVSVASSASVASSVDQQIAQASGLIEMERMKMRIYMLEQQLEAAHLQIDDIKAQRDQWQKQASQVLITSEYSQRQAEELKEQIRQRDERVRAARAKRDQQKMNKQVLEKKLQEMTSHNQNAPAQAHNGSFVDASRTYVDLTQDTAAGEAGKGDSGLMSGFFRRLRGAA